MERSVALSLSEDLLATADCLEGESLDGREEVSRALLKPYSAGTRITSAATTW